MWLMESRKNVITDGKTKSYSYLTSCMVPAEKYIKTINPAKITSEIKSDANYKLYQLMEVYVDCKIIAKWLSLESVQDKLEFINNFIDIDYLKEVCNFYDTGCSLFEYESFSDEMKKTTTFLFDENINDFVKAFKKCVDGLDNQIYEDGLTKIDALESMLSFYINQGVWASLRIITNNLCKFDKISFQGCYHNNYNYISGQLFSFDKKFKLIPIINNLEFYINSAKESFINFLMLAKKIYNSETEIKLYKIEQDIVNIKKDITKQENRLYLLKEIVDKINTKNNEKAKLKMYKSLSQEELINIFYDFYKVPSNFLDILQNYKFEDKLILNGELKITRGYQALLITYLDKFVVDRKDICLLKVLFNIKAKNPQSSKKKYVERLKAFENFIKKSISNT